METVKEIIVVEGRYDKNTVLQAVRASVVETDGFGIFSDKEKAAFLRRLAESKGIIILTDGDGAGFVIRNHLRGILPKERVKHAYIPDIKGKERRKSAPSKEGKLGVEGMSPQIIVECLRRAGATFLSGPAADVQSEISKADFYAAGLSGRPDSREKRASLLRKLELPEMMTSNALLEVLNALYTKDEFTAFIGS